MNPSAVSIFDGGWSQGDPDPGNPSNVTNPGASGDDRVGVDSSSWGRIKAEGF
ncbi:MAG: hypothetical protein NTW26_08055 [bacterium]|nr:hypothetical protein [bacterium]